MLDILSRFSNFAQTSWTIKTEKCSGKDHHLVRRGREDSQPGGHNHVRTRLRESLYALWRWVLVMYTRLTIYTNLKHRSKAFYFISSLSWRLEGDSAEVSRRNDHRLFSRRLPPFSNGILGSEACRTPPDAAASRKQTAFHLWRPQQDPALLGGGANTQREQQWVIQFTSKPDF